MAVLPMGDGKGNCSSFYHYYIEDTVYVERDVYKRQAMLSPAAGLGLYFLLNYLVYGRWNHYQIYQWDNWNQKLGLFTNTVRYHLDYMAQWWDLSLIHI